MLSLVTKDREKLSQRLAAETDIRKRLESEKRELERKLRLGSATNQLETRKAREMNEALGRKKDEMTELRQMLQRQTIEITNLQAANAAKDKRLQELERKMSQYDDSFYSLEARNLRDRTKMEEMGKAKGRAEDERAIYRHMLEQAHERALKERQELRRDAQSKLEASSARVKQKKQRVLLLEKELREKSQVDEEKEAYREQCQALMEQCQSLMEQLSAAHGGGQPVQLPPVRSNAASSATSSPGGGGLFGLMRKGMTAAQSAAERAPGYDGHEG